MTTWPAAIGAALSLLLLAAPATLHAATVQDTVRYTVAVDDPSTKLLHVTAEFPVEGEELLASLPAWTPGSYDIEDYARNVRSFAATDEQGRALDWDKQDPDTWRVRTGGAGVVRLAFDVHADSLELDKSKVFDDFAFFNGTNLFPFESERTGRPATLSLELPPGWQAANGLTPAGEGRFTAASYDELVDAPTFLGVFQLDRFTAGGKPSQLAVYPADAFSEEQRARLRRDIDAILTEQNEIVGAVPYDTYTTLLYIGEASFAGGLEHANSHFDVLPPSVAQGFEFALPIVQSLLAHETFHLWNVKRIRPATMWPYDYDEWQPTELLWFSEGVTDYYADLTVARADLYTDEQFFEQVEENATTLAFEPGPVAVEDASLNTWIDPTLGNRYIYYAKGALLGLLLDLRIRHATANERSLDDVVRRLYREFYAEGRGFTTEDLLRLLREAGDPDVDAFYERHVDGREPLPLAETLRLAGLLLETEETRVPTLGVTGGLSPAGEIVIAEVVPDSPAAEAGVQPGDVLVRVGDLAVADPAWGDEFRRKYSDREGAPLPILVRREGQEQALEARVHLTSTSEIEVARDPAAGELERRILQDLLD